jgi:hypothetical protein
MEDLKKRAKELGLWNLFLPKNHYTEGAGFSNLEYGLMAEYLGKSRVSQEVYCRVLLKKETYHSRQRITLLLILAIWRF